jgi:hypothetical protein
MPANLKVIITGATGMVGEGVLHECLQHPNVESVLVINRRPCGITHGKLKEIIHPDFFNFSPIESQLAGYDTCLFCLGVSSVGMKADEYYRMTYTLTMHVAETLERQQVATFCYISGAGTDSTEKGRSRWARVKGKTENDLGKLSFKSVFNFRPGFIKPTPGLKNTLSLYKYFGWLYPVGRGLYPKGFCTLRELGLAMIEVSLRGFDRRIVEGDDIIALAKRSEVGAGN